jgi:hypothetical protein
MRLREVTEMLTDRRDASRRRLRLGVLAAAVALMALVGLTSVGTTATAADVVANASEPEPTSEDDGSDATDATTVDGTDGGTDGGTGEEDLEPGDVAIGVWIAAGILVLAAIVWSVRGTGNADDDETAAGDPDD